MGNYKKHRIRHNADLLVHIRSAESREYEFFNRDFSESLVGTYPWIFGNFIVVTDEDGKRQAMMLPVFIWNNLWGICAK